MGNVKEKGERLTAGPRQDGNWKEAIRHHGVATILATAWGAAIYWLNPHYAWWLAPIVGALIISIPVSVLVSRVSIGAAARRVGLLVTPEESAPPPEIVELDRRIVAAREKERELEPAERDGFVRAVVDPYVNALHRWLLRGPRLLSPSIHEKRGKLVERALADGPAALGARERGVLLVDPDRVDELHRRVWELAAHERARAWGRPGGTA